MSAAGQITAGTWSMRTGLHGSTLISSPSAKTHHAVAKIFASPNAEANARLITTAPELLEVCRKAHSTISDECVGGVDHPVARMLYDAITKATDLMRQGRR